MSWTSLESTFLRRLPCRPLFLLLRGSKQPRRTWIHGYVYFLGTPKWLGFTFRIAFEASNPSGTLPKLFRSPCLKPAKKNAHTLEIWAETPKCFQRTIAGCILWFHLPRCYFGYPPPHIAMAPKGSFWVPRDRNLI